MKKLLLLMILSTVIICSCDNKKNEEEKAMLQSQVDSLQKIVASLQTELEGYKFAPEKLCAQAEQLFKDNNEPKLKDILGKLKKYHPDASEVVTVEKYIKTIEDNRAKEQERIRAERMQAVDILNKKYDDVKGTTWFRSKLIVHNNWSNMASLYIGKDKSMVWLRLKMSYYGDDWIFFDDAYLSYEGNTYSVSFDKYREKETDNSGGMVWEWIDVNVDGDLLNYLKLYVKGQKPKMRLTGKYTHDRNLSAKEIKAMQEVLLAYDVLKNGR